MQKIIVRHLSGGRRDQVDSFPAGDYELIVGRDPSAHVRFDQDREDLVSRQHVKIMRDPRDPNGFQVVDLQSRNGTFLNRQRVLGSSRLAHNDVIQLGAGGPELRFELDPPPLAASAPARETTLGFSAAKPTRESWLPGPAGRPQPVGRGTVERMLGDVFTRAKKQSSRGAWAVGVAAVAVVALLGTGTYFLMRRSETAIKADVTDARARTDAAMVRVQQGVEKSNQAATEVQRLEAELEEANRRNDANNRALAAELGKARRDAAVQSAALDRARRDEETQAAELNRLIKQQQTAPTPPPPAATTSSEAVDPNKFDDLRREAEAKVDQDPAAAQDLADQLIQMDVSRWEGYALAGRIASLRSDYRRAADMYQRALDRAPAGVRPDLQKKLQAARSLVQP